MTNVTVSSQFGEIEIDLDNDPGAVIFAISAPDSICPEDVAELIEKLDPNSSKGTLVFTKLADAKKLGDSSQVEALVLKLDTSTPEGLLTAMELMGREIFNDEQIGRLGLKSQPARLGNCPISSGVNNELVTFQGKPSGDLAI